MPLELLPAGANIALWAMKKLYANRKLIEIGANQIYRIGDKIVWKDETQTRILAGLTNLAESEIRIERAIQGIDRTQIAIQDSIGAIHSLSMFSFGALSLSSVYMASRLRSLETRMKELQSLVEDILGNLEAKDRAHLKTGIEYLTRYEANTDSKCLDTALEYSTYSANIFADLVLQECNRKQRRLPVINLRGRWYLLSLMTELRCLQLTNRSDDLVRRYMDQAEYVLRPFARAVYDETLLNRLEVYLDPVFASAHVTLELVTDLQRQAERLGVTQVLDVCEPAQLFEHLRTKIYSKRPFSKGVFALKGRPMELALRNLKYMISCLEEIGKIDALRLSAEHGGDISEENLKFDITEWREANPDQVQRGADNVVLAYSFL